MRLVQEFLFYNRRRLLADRRLANGAVRGAAIHRMHPRKNVVGSAREPTADIFSTTRRTLRGPASRSS